jgi:predicted transcriptional regulator of viral defense system
MRLDTFFAQHTVFTFEEIASFLSQTEKAKSSTIYNLLAYHQKQGHIVRIRRGLYHSVPKGIESTSCPIDAFLVASRMASDAVLGYRTALDLFGKLHSVQNEFIYISNKQEKKPYVFKDVTYRKASIPLPLTKLKKENFGVTSLDRLGQKILVTSLERTLVDVLDRPNLCGSWEEIWRSLESIEYVNIDRVLEYALLLGNATTIAKVGFYLEMHRKELLIPDEALEKLCLHRPKNPHYLEREQEASQKMISKWNIIVPLSLLNRQWEEPNEDV